VLYRHKFQKAGGGGTTVATSLSPESDVIRPLPLLHFRLQKAAAISSCDAAKSAAIFRILACRVFLSSPLNSFKPNGLNNALRS
jgi:hypothetical protein